MAPLHPDTGFDRIAWVYDALAFLVFGNALKRAQAVFLSAVPLRSQILIIGGGSGWLLQQVLFHCQPRDVLYVEAPTRMLSLAKR